MKGLLSHSIGRFRIISMVEGISWILLAFVAVPLKYVFGLPEMVKILGRVHGFLFVAFLLMLLWVMIELKWNIFKKPLILFISSLIPFGCFYVDKKILKPEQDRLYRTKSEPSN